MNLLTKEEITRRKLEQGKNIHEREHKKYLYLNAKSSSARRSFPAQGLKLAQRSKRTYGSTLTLPTLATVLGANSLTIGLWRQGQ